MLESAETIEFMLTHSLVPTGPIPTSYDPDGVYPYESFSETSRRPEIRWEKTTSQNSEHTGIILRVRPIKERQLIQNMQSIQQSELSEMQLCRMSVERVSQS
jgi:hypothetical protein